MLLDKELSNLVNSEIAVIMNDGSGYRGKLIKCDRDIIVLENIYETSNQEIEWVEAKAGNDKKPKAKGYLAWRKVTLPQVIIRVPMVLRIWPWTPISKD
jgi:small nuclear ribonucleoprotein (snRNP)-like protein